MPQTAVANRMTAGLVGQLSDFESADNSRRVTAFSEEVSAGIDVGIFVAQGTAPDGVKLPSSQADKIRGLVMRTHEFARGVELDTDLFLTPGTHFAVLTRGTMTVAPKETVVPGDEVHVQVIAEVGFLVGDVRKTGSVGKTLDFTGFCRWLTAAASIGDPTVLEIDMNNFALAVAD